MPTDFSSEYAERSDEELLLLASDRASLTNDAIAALDAELARRKLTNADQVEHQRLVRRYEQRESKRRQRKLFGSSRDRGSWVDAFWAVLAIALISVAYLALPSEYHLKGDWQEAAVAVMFSSVFIAVGSSIWRRKLAFWISLLISSAIHLLVVHAWIQRAGTLRHSKGQLAVLLGFVLFFAVYGFSRILRRNWYGEEANGATSGR